MPWGAAAIAGSAIIGGMASRSAANTQAASTDRATQVASETADKQTELQREQFNKQLELNEPFRQAGLTGQNMLLAQLQGPYGSAKFGGVPGYDPASAMRDFGGVAGYDPASAMRNFGAGDFQADPGYAFRLSEGMKALDRTAASRGGLLSGATLKGAQRYGSDLASQEYGNAYNRFQANRATQSQEYQNAFNRYQAERAAKEQGFGNAFNRFQAERSNTLAPLQSLAGVGQSATQQAQQASQNFATGAANTLANYGNAAASNAIGAGNARASGYMGAANALGSSVGQGLNFYQNQNYLDRRFPSTGGVGGGGTNYLSGMTTLGGVDRPDFDMSVY
tara:strand:- start:1709 stop:2716 length:1008 start_codon:yes stop_codon:yes gene_type:complete